MPDNHVTEDRPVSLTMEQLRTILEEIKKPYVDPEITARLERHRARLRQQRADNERAREARERVCPHVRRDGTSTVAWMTTPGTDGVTPFTRGVCQRCLKLFLPGQPDYERALAIPTGSDDIIYG